MTKAIRYVPVMFIALSGSAIAGKPQQFFGIWLYEFEGSTFIAGATKVPAKRPPFRTTAWLTYDPEFVLKLAELNQSYDRVQRCCRIHAFAIKSI